MGPGFARSARAPGRRRSMLLTAVVPGRAGGAHPEPM